jgi:hypothetical protein
MRVAQDPSRTRVRFPADPPCNQFELRFVIGTETPQRLVGVRGRCFSRARSSGSSFFSASCLSISSKKESRVEPIFGCLLFIGLLFHGGHLLRSLARSPLRVLGVQHGSLEMAHDAVPAARAACDLVRHAASALRTGRRRKRFGIEFLRRHFLILATSVLILELCRMTRPTPIHRTRQ